MNNHRRRRAGARHFSFWNYLLLLLVLVSSVVYALPNVYGNDPSLVIASSQQPVSAQLATQHDILELLS